MISVVVVWAVLRTRWKQAAGNFTSHAAWVLCASSSVAGRDAVGAMAPLPPLLPCLRRLAGTGYRVAGPWLTALPAKGRNYGGQRSGMGMPPWTTPQALKGGCSMMRNCDESMTDL